MRLIDVINGPWAITVEMLTEIQRIYATHLRGEKIDIKALEAKLGQPLNNQPLGYDIINGVAVIPIDGVIAKKMNLMMQVSGGVSSELVKNDFRAALNDPSVSSIILHIDSPGGTVDGTAELADMIYQARGIKPIVAFTDGMMASAAYWIGAAADKIYISSDTSVVGSIGVVTSHVDVSKSEEMIGIKTSEISAGKFKRIASEYAPLSDAGRATIQERVDYLYSVFVNHVAQFRGVSVDQVLSNMADGRIFTGKQAIAAGLVDGVSTLAGLIEGLAVAGLKPALAGKTNKALAGVAGAKIEKEVTAMTKEDLIAQFPDIYQAAVSDGTAGMEAAVAAAKEEGIKAEQARILGIDALNLPGHEKMIAEFKADGKTQPGEAAVKILAAEKVKGKNHLEALNADAAAAGDVPAAPAPAPGTEGAGAQAKGFEALVEAYVAEHKCTKSVAMSAIVKAHPAEYEAYIKKVNA